MIQIPNYPAVDSSTSVPVEKDVKDMPRRESHPLIVNKKCTYAPSFLGSAHLSLTARSRVRTRVYVQANCGQDVVQLLAIIQGYCCQFNDNQQCTHMHLKEQRT